MMSGRLVLVVFLVLLVSGCDTDSSKVSVVKEQEPAAETSAAFDPMLSTVDRARAVQGVQDDRSAGMDATVEEAGR
jgi:outer membrane PBP1 activator LpoA protein